MYYFFFRNCLVFVWFPSRIVLFFSFLHELYFLVFFLYELFDFFLSFTILYQYIFFKDLFYCFYPFPEDFNFSSPLSCWALGSMLSCYLPSSRQQVFQKLSLAKNSFIQVALLQIALLQVALLQVAHFTASTFYR